jgi:hypothetical protein
VFVFYLLATWPTLLALVVGLASAIWGTIWLEKNKYLWYMYDPLGERGFLEFDYFGTDDEDVDSNGGDNTAEEEDFGDAEAADEDLFW